jgi:hypothetical protein
MARGHVVRGTTRDPRRVGQIEAAGAEAVVGDPDRIATLAGALEHVGVACVLLGSAAGQARQLEALHGSRLEMLLSRMLDSTVRGIVWEAAGGVDPDLLQAGAQRVRTFCEDSRIPYAMLEADPSDHDAWLAAAIAAVERVLHRS